MGTSIIASILSLIFAFAQGAHTIQVPADPIEVDGDTVSRAVTPATEVDTLRVAGEDGLYQSTESGWTKLGPPPPPGKLIDGGADSDLMMAGDHEPCGRGGSSVSLQRSSDDGQTWSAVDGAAGYRPLAIWPESDLVLASSCLGLHTSLDGGLTWSPVEGIEPGWEVTSFATVPQADGGGPVVLVGLTGEGGTSYLRSIDFTDSSAPVVSSDLRTYYAIGGLTGKDDTYVLAVLDGIWISEDAGASWERSRSGLEDVTLDRDPLEYGLPQDMNPNAYGLLSVARLSGERPGIVVGSVDGLYTSYQDSPDWTRIEGTSGRVTGIVVSSDGTLLLFATDDGVYRIDIVTST